MNNRLEQIYIDYKNNIDLKKEELEIEQLSCVKKELEYDLSVFNEEIREIDFYIEENKKYIEDEEKILNKYNEELEEYAKKNGNIFDRIMYHTDKIPVIDQIAAIIIGLPSLFLQIFLEPFFKSYFNQNTYLTNSQKEKRQLIENGIDSIYRVISSENDKKKHIKRIIEQIEYKLTNIAYLNEIKRNIINRIEYNNYTKLYYIRLKWNNTFLYKIGITKYDVPMRYSQDSLSSNIDSIIFEIPLENAEYIESKIIEHNKLFLHIKHGIGKLLDSGNSEIFIEDVLSVDFLSTSQNTLDLDDTHDDELLI